MATHENLPAIRWVNNRIYSEIGIAHLIISSAVIPASAGLLAMLLFGVHGGAAIWMALQIIAIGAAGGVYLTKARTDLASYEKAIDAWQADVAESALIRRLYNNPILEYWVIGWGTFVARAWVAIVSFVSAVLSGLPVPFAVVLLIGQAIHPVLTTAAIVIVLMTVQMFWPAALFSQGAMIGAAIIAATPLLATFSRVHYDHKRQNDFADGSTFYAAHEVHVSLLNYSLYYGGGYERARDAISLATRKEAMPQHAQDDGWRPMVGDLHKGQQLNTSDLAATLRNQDEE